MSIKSVSKQCRTVLLFCLLLGATTFGQTWFPPSTSWLAQRLNDVGCQKVKHSGGAVGGLLEGTMPGPAVVFSSNDPESAIRVLEAMGIPERGQVVTVFGSGVKLEHGDYLIKVEFTDSLRSHQLALPNSGPSIDSFELVLTAGTSMPALAVASDLVVCLQNRARTASEFVLVQLEHYRPMANGNLAVDLSLRVFDPTFRDEAASALVEIARERLQLHGATLVSSNREAASNSGQWPMVRKALGDELEIIAQNPPQTALFFEDFGRPAMPALTLRAGSTDPATIQALARVLQAVLTLE